MWKLSFLFKELRTRHWLTLFVLSAFALASCATNQSYYGIPLTAGAAPSDLQSLATRARQGDAGAQHDLAVRFRDGASVTKDASKADKLFKLSTQVRPSRVWVYQPSINGGVSGSAIVVDVGAGGGGTSVTQGSSSVLNQTVELQIEKLNPTSLKATLKQVSDIIVRKPTLLKGRHLADLHQALVGEVGLGEGIAVKVPSVIAAETYVSSFAQESDTSINYLICKSVCPPGSKGYRALAVSDYRFGEVWGGMQRLPSELSQEYRQRSNQLSLSEFRVGLDAIGYSLAKIDAPERTSHAMLVPYFAIFTSDKGTAPIVAIFNAEFSGGFLDYDRSLIRNILFLFIIEG